MADVAVGQVGCREADDEGNIMVTMGTMLMTALCFFGVARVHAQATGPHER